MIYLRNMKTCDENKIIQERQIRGITSLHWGNKLFFLFLTLGQISGQFNVADVTHNEIARDDAVEK